MAIKIGGYIFEKQENQFYYPKSQQYPNIHITMKLPPNVTNISLNALTEKFLDSFEHQGKCRIRISLGQSDMAKPIHFLHLIEEDQTVQEVLHQKILGHGNKSITQMAEFLEGLKTQILKKKTIEELKQLRKQRRQEHQAEHQQKQKDKSQPAKDAKTEEVPQASEKQAASSNTQQKEGAEQAK